MKLWKFNSGIYPVVPGLSIRLGDYGYWKNDQWCHIGNIQQIESCPRIFSIRREPLNQEVSECLESSFEADGNMSADADNIKVGSTLKFNKKNSMFFKGILCDYESYSSIEMEIKPFLMKLQKEGKWDSEYWLAYYIVYSDGFIAMRSKAAGVSAIINAELSIDNIRMPKAGVLASISYDANSIETTVGCGDDKKYAGAKFLSLQTHGIFKREVKIKYNKDNQAVILD